MIAASGISAGDPAALGSYVPQDARALIAVDLGAESCRVSLLRWISGSPHVQLVHRFPNGPVRAADGSLRWPLDAIVSGVEQGMRMCAEHAPEGVRSVAVDGWAVDYVRVDADRRPLDAPYCYRDERTIAAEAELHRRISPDCLRAITGLQLQTLNTLYQLFADKLAGHSPGMGWVNLPEYLLMRWGGNRVAEYTNATHTQMVQLEGESWSREILEAAGIDPALIPKLVPPGTILGDLEGELAQLPAFSRTALIAPACHDTASAVAGIPAIGEDWGYISCGTWSLVGTPLNRACNGPKAREEQFTNLGGVGGRLLFQRNLNGMWLIKQCMDFWAATDREWEIEELVVAAENVVVPEGLLDIEDPELLKMGEMPSRINAQRRAAGLTELDEGSDGAPAMASLIFHSLAARYAMLFERMEELTGKTLERIFMVGGGSRNAFLRRLTSEASGKPVFAGSAESSTVGNFAVQLAALERRDADHGESFRESVAFFASLLLS